MIDSLEKPHGFPEAPTQDTDGNEPQNKTHQNALRAGCHYLNTTLAESVALFFSVPNCGEPLCFAIVVRLTTKLKGAPCSAVREPHKKSPTLALPPGNHLGLAKTPLGTDNLAPSWPNLEGTNIRFSDPA